MKLRLSLLAWMSCVFFAAPACLWGAEQASPLSDAIARYDQGQFTQAAADFERLLDQGMNRSEIYYNAGNARLRAGEAARALLHYRRAQRLNPRDPDIQWNIAIVKKIFTDRIEDATAWWWKPAARFIGYWRVDELAITVLFGAIALWIGTILRWRRVALRATRVLLIAAFITTCLSAVLLGARMIQVSGRHVVVTDTEVLARYGPSERETKAFVLHTGAEAKITDESRDWYQVTLTDRHAGWIPKTSCEII